ncbi:hypothetical protein PENSPDRAFT_679307 [Peniophora sp. CONT]|nr:hypothetical protein PENSPDRAFT_679307 [Peniophora sp. CONT]
MSTQSLPEMSSAFRGLMQDDHAPVARSPTPGSVSQHPVRPAESVALHSPISTKVEGLDHAPGQTGALQYPVPNLKPDWVLQARPLGPSTSNVKLVVIIVETRYGQSAFSSARDDALDEDVDDTDSSTSSDYDCADASVSPWVRTLRSAAKDLDEDSQPRDGSQIASSQGLVDVVGGEPPRPISDWGPTVGYKC